MTKKRTSSSSKTTTKKKTKKNNNSFTQKGTGLHLDCNPYNMWKTQNQKDGKYKELEWWRPFQSFLALSDATNDRSLQDGGLEIVPGFYAVCERYFQQHDAGTTHGRNLFRWGSYNTKFSKLHDDWVLRQTVKAQRIPTDWQDDPSVLSKTSEQCKTMSSYKRYVIQTAKSHKKLEYVPIQKGDFVIWDIRTPHQNSSKNETDTIRSVFYHAYMVAQPSTINQDRITKYAAARRKREHTTDFPKTWKEIEKDIPKTKLDTQLAKLLFDQKKWDTVTKDNEFEALESNMAHLLTDKHIAFYKRFGYVVVENVFSSDTADTLFEQAVAFCKNKGCDMMNPEMTPKEWSLIAGRFGAMVELFYQPEMEKIRVSPSTYAITARLNQQTWGSQKFDFKQPFSDFDGRKLWLYIDRMNIRYPDTWAKKIPVEQSDDHEDQVQDEEVEEPPAKRQKSK
jgi:hypothetical protein